MPCFFYIFPGLRLAFLAVALAAAGGAYAQEAGEPQVRPRGEQKSGKTQALELGAKVLQGKAPLRGFDIYLVGFHPMKEHPEEQMTAHHFCHQVNEDFAQCVLFDGNTEDASLTGIEYIISEKAFATLSQEERKYWHPHNAEILSGQLMAPGIPAVAERSLMKSKLNSYGKTWHVWSTGKHGGKGDELPLGPAMLAWSFNRDGEAIPDMIAKRDRDMGLDTKETRAQREELTQLARPQSGVDALKGKFDRPTREIPGV